MVIVGVTSLFTVMKELKRHQPVFVDFTWGAGIFSCISFITPCFHLNLAPRFNDNNVVSGGSTSDLTLDLCRRAKEELGLNPNMHLTCTNMELEKVDAALEGCKSSGNIILNLPTDHAGIRCMHP